MEETERSGVVHREKGRPSGGESYLYTGGTEAQMADEPKAELEVVTGEVIYPHDPRGGAELVLAEKLLRDRHPVLVYLMSLSEGSRRTMRAYLENIAQFVSRGEADAMTLAWHELRYQHTTFIRSTLAQAYKPATANKMLSALRGVLKECFRLGYMTAEDYQRARDLRYQGPLPAPPNARSPKESSGDSSRFAPKAAKGTGVHGTPPWSRCSTGAA